MKKYIAEMIGTMVLVLMGCGSAAFAGSVAGTVGAGVGTIGVALAFGLSVVAMAYTIGNLSGVEWIVVGTETGRRRGKVDARPEWVRGIVAQARAQGVAVFMKEDLLPIMGESGMIQELPEAFKQRIWNRN